MGAQSSVTSNKWGPLMAHIQVEASVRTHRKFLQAGPAASWLWLCSVGYSQDGLTDGFIPFEAINYLGVKAPQNLKAKLVEVGLWEQVEGGWQIHDYAKHNRTAAQVNSIKQAKRTAGAAGGRASGEARREAPASARAEPPREPISYTDQIQHRSATSQTQSPPVRSATLVQPYRQSTNVAHTSGCGNVPHFLHSEFVVKIGNVAPDAEDGERIVRAFYASVDAQFAGQVVGEEPVKFWRARFAEKWPSTSPVKRGIDAWQPKTAVQP